MAVDQRLKELTDWRDEIEGQMRETVKAGATDVSDSDASVRRIALVSLERQRDYVNKLINRHLIQRGGGDPLLGFHAQNVDAGKSGTVYEDIDS